eukprot:7384053-Prymnesium_polylepis.7
MSEHLWSDTRPSVWTDGEWCAVARAGRKSRAQHAPRQDGRMPTAAVALVEEASELALPQGAQVPLLLGHPLLLDEAPHHLVVLAGDLVHLAQGRRRRFGPLRALAELLADQAERLQLLLVLRLHLRRVGRPLLASQLRSLARALEVLLHRSRALLHQLDDVLGRGRGRGLDGRHRRHPRERCSDARCHARGLLRVFLRERAELLRVMLYRCLQLLRVESLLRRRGILQLLHSELRLIECSLRSAAAVYTAVPLISLTPRCLSSAAATPDWYLKSSAGTTPSWPAICCVHAAAISVLSSAVAVSLSFAPPNERPGARAVGCIWAVGCCELMLMAARGDPLSITNGVGGGASAYGDSILADLWPASASQRAAVALVCTHNGRAAVAHGCWLPTAAGCQRLAVIERVCGPRGGRRGEHSYAKPHVRPGAPSLSRVDLPLT